MTTVRPARPGDGPGCAAVWIDAGRYYQALDPAAFQIPDADGLAASFENDIAAAGPDQLHFVADPGDGTVTGLLVAVLRHPGARPDHELVRDQSRLRLHIQILVVLSAHRRTGTGTALPDGGADLGGRPRRDGRPARHLPGQPHLGAVLRAPHGLRPPRRRLPPGARLTGAHRVGGGGAGH
jgi:hypothetical protein